ncbi:MAG: SBBP repeat-containing protein [Bacteroidales bacterium]
MKKLLLLLFSFISFAGNAGDFNTNIEREANAKEWINKQALEFIENKGQFANSDGKVADNVLFKASYGNCDIYITDKGLTYVFKKIEKDSLFKPDSRLSKLDKLKSKFDKRKEENNKLFYFRLDMNLEGAEINKSNVIKEGDSQQGHYNYFFAHCPQGIYDVKGYEKITIKNIYKGIDWVIYTNTNSKEHPLKYDFIVHPGADYKEIKIIFQNAQNISLCENDSKLKIKCIAATLEEGSMHSFMKDGVIEVQSKYKISADTTISFEMANYDTTKTLIIDPLVWATYYGGGMYEDFNSVCVDSKDNVYITGMAMSLDFPLLQLNGAFWQPVNIGQINSSDIFILKFNCSGVRKWSTFYGGTKTDYGMSICTDKNNNLFITGNTESFDLPLQQNANAYYQSTNNGIQLSAFIIKFNDIGIRQWATYYGGEMTEKAESICTDKQNNIYIVGGTYSTAFPVQQIPGSYFQNHTPGATEDAFILKFDNMGVRLWATYYGGEGLDQAMSVVTDSNDNIYVVGATMSALFPLSQLNNSYYQNSYGDINSSDIFILKFNQQGIRQWATCYGGYYLNDVAYSVCTDNQNNVYVTGATDGVNFPTFQLPGAYFQNNALIGFDKIFILKFDESGNRQWATLYYGDYDNYGFSIRTDKNDNLYLTGQTQSGNFPTLQLNGEYFQTANIISSGATFILKFNKFGVRQWSTLYGTFPYQNYDCVGKEISIDSENNVYLIGSISSSGAYTANPGSSAYYDSIWSGYRDGYILKIGSDILNSRPIDLKVNVNNICKDEFKNIILTAKGGINNLLIWYTGSCGQNYIGQNSPLTIAAPKETTTFYVRYESACGNSECDSILFTVKDCQIILDLPNFFSPNGDKNNDYFIPVKIEGILSMKTLIYNRWGTLVYSTDDLKINWDGKTNKGDKVADGVYYWIVDYKDINGLTSGKHGSVTIMN